MRVQFILRHFESKTPLGPRDCFEWIVTLTDSSLVVLWGWHGFLVLGIGAGRLGRLVQPAGRQPQSGAFCVASGRPAAHRSCATNDRPLDPLRIAVHTGVY